MSLDMIVCTIASHAMRKGSSVFEQVDLVILGDLLSDEDVFLRPAACMGGSMILQYHLA
jgi:hypothetical protein